MTILIAILVGLVLASAGVFVYARFLRLQISATTGANAGFREIDVNAMLRLCDPDDREFIRRSVDPAVFRELEKRRLAALSAYLTEILANTQFILSTCAVAFESGDAEARANAERIAALASRVRTAAIIANMKVAVARLLPGYETGLADMAASYRAAVIGTKSLIRHQSSPS